MEAYICVTQGSQSKSISLDSKNELIDLGIDKLKELIQSKISNVAQVERVRANLSNKYNQITSKDPNVHQSYERQIEEATGYITNDTNAVPKLYDALTECYVLQCKENNPVNQKEALSELARLQLTNRGIEGKSISNKFEVPQEYSSEELTNITTALAESLKDQGPNLSMSCLDLGLEQHNLATQHLYHMERSVSNYPYHERLAMFFYMLARALDPTSYEVEHDSLLKRYCALANKEPFGYFERAKTFYAFRKENSLARHPHEECYKEIMALCEDPVLLEQVALWTLSRGVMLKASSPQRVNEAQALRDKATIYQTK